MDFVIPAWMRMEIAFPFWQGIIVYCYGQSLEWCPERLRIYRSSSSCVELLARKMLEFSDLGINNGDSRSPYSGFKTNFLDLTCLFLIVALPYRNGGAHQGNEMVVRSYGIQSSGLSRCAFPTEILDSQLLAFIFRASKNDWPITILTEKARYKFSLPL